MTDGILMCDKRQYPNGELVQSGPLALAATSFQPWTLGIADPVMVLTEAKITGVFDSFLYLKKDGKTYRYERSDTYGETLTRGKLIDSFTEFAEPENIRWEIYEFEEIPSRYSVLAVVDGVYQMRYDHAPPKALHSSILPQMKADGMIVAEDGVLTSGFDAWNSFYENTTARKSDSIIITQYYTLQKERCSAEYYEAYKEDYPYLVNMELSYDGAVYRLRWWENNIELERELKYLVRFDDVETGDPERKVKYWYHLVEDKNKTWSEQMKEMFSSYRPVSVNGYSLFSELE